MSIFLLPPGQCIKSIYTFNAVTALCFVPEEDGYIITGSGVFLWGEQVHVEKLRASDTVNRIIGVQCCHFTSYLCLPLYMFVFWTCSCMNAGVCICHTVAQSARELESAGLSGRSREMEAHSLGSQAQVDRP